MIELLLRTSTLLLPEAKSIYSLEDTGNKVQSQECRMSS